MPFPYPKSLVDATLQFLRKSPCEGAFGDSFDPGPPPIGIQKFFGDYAGEVDQPYLIIGEPNENKTFFTKGQGAIPFLADGILVVSIFAGDRGQARDLGQLVRVTLDDQSYGWEGVANIGYLRQTAAFFVPVPATAPGLPSTFNRVLTFQYQYQGAQGAV